MNLKEKKEQIRIKKISKRVLETPNKISLCKDNKLELKSSYKKIKEIN